MAAPKRNRNKEGHQKTIDKIRTTQLVKRLQCHALGVPDDAGNDVNLNSSQIRAIEILIKKVIPDLSSTEWKGDPDSPLTVVNKIELTSPDDDSES